MTSPVTDSPPPVITERDRFWLTIVGVCSIPLLFIAWVIASVAFGLVGCFFGNCGGNHP